MGRRSVKEYKASEALVLIAADREHRPLVCPTCGSTDIQRSPARRSGSPPSGHVTLRCSGCDRTAGYLDRGPVDSTSRTP